MNTLTFKENSMSKILCYNDNFYTTNQITSLAEHICRFNNLHEHSFSKKEINIMPTFTLNALDYLNLIATYLPTQGFQIYPNGKYGPAGDYHMYPDGTYGPGRNSYLRPDSSYGSTPNFTLAPNGKYIDLPS